MKVEYTKLFLKQFKKLRSSERDQFIARLELWQKDPHAKVLRTHSLTGKYRGAQSINVTGDIRAVFFYLNDETVKFVLIGSHSQLYG